MWIGFDEVVVPAPLLTAYTLMFVDAESIEQ
jgi:hypothetical protein